MLERILPSGISSSRRQILAEGDVSARIHLLTNGSVGSVTMIDGHPLLAEPVREALTQWKFESLTHELDLDVTVRFSLVGTGKEGFPPQQIRGSLPHLFAVSTTPPPPLGPDVEPLKPKRNTK